MTAHATGRARYQYLVVGQLCGHRQQASPRRRRRNTHLEQLRELDGELGGHDEAQRRRRSTSCSAKRRRRIKCADGRQDATQKKKIRCRRRAENEEERDGGWGDRWMGEVMDGGSNSKPGSSNFVQLSFSRCGSARHVALIFAPSLHLISAAQEIWPQQP
jgi:hypothetical protein